jgi:hypothetical protein
MPKIVMPPISSTNASDVRKLLGKPNAVAEVSDQVTIPPTIQAEHGRAGLSEFEQKSAGGREAACYRCNMAC